VDSAGVQKSAPEIGIAIISQIPPVSWLNAKIIVTKVKFRIKIRQTKKRAEAGSQKTPKKKYKAQ